MKTRVITMREKAIATIASLAMATTMVVVAPMAAMADDDEQAVGTIQVLSQPVIDISTTMDMTTSFSCSVVPEGTEYHVDYFVSAGTGTATINKHSGLLTPQTTGTVTVTAKMTVGERGNGSATTVCGGDTAVIASNSTTVTITGSSDTYTPQGVTNTIKMENPSVSSFGGSNSEGWTNILSSIDASSTYYYFTLTTGSGFKDYNSADAFAARNDGNITLTDGNNEVIDTLSELNDGDVIISSVDNTTKTVVVGVRASAISSGAKLVFESGFKGNSNTSTLGTTVTFVINIA